MKRRVERALSGLGVAAACAALWQCHAFGTVDDCNADTDCARGLRCNAASFCEAAPVRLGLVAAKSGELKLVDFGRTALSAARFFQASLQGTLAGRFAVEDADDSSTVEGSVVAAKSLLAANVFGMVGPVTSSETLEVQKLTFDSKLLQVAPFAGASVLGAAQPGGLRARYLFQLTTTIANGAAPAIVRFVFRDGASAEVDEAAAAVTARCKGAAVGVVTSKDTTGEAYRDAFAHELAGVGVTPVVAELQTARQADYEDARNQLKDAGVKCVFLALQPDAGGAFVAESATNRNEFQFFTVSLLHGPAFLSAVATPGVADGIYGADIDGRPPSSEYAQLKNAYVAALDGGVRGLEPLDEDGELPNLFASHFDAYALLALAYARATGFEPGKIVKPSALRDAFVAIATAQPGDETVVPVTLNDALRAAASGKALDYKGASGSLEFDETGFVSSPTLIWRITAGRFDNGVFRYDETGTARPRTAR